MTIESKRWERAPNESRERTIRFVQAFITAQMRHRNMRPAEFARFTGLKKDAVSTYLRGRAAPSDHALWQMAEACGVQISDIVPDREDIEIADALPIIANCPEFAIGPARHGHVTLHIRKIVTLDLALQIGKLIEANGRAAD